MDDIQSKLLSLTDVELRNYLAGTEDYDGTPVTSLTRTLLVRKLTRNLLKNQNSEDSGGCASSTANSSTTDANSPNGSAHECTSSSLTEYVDNPKVYFGVYVPRDKNSKRTTDAGDAIRVFTQKRDVMSCMKEFPDARFNIFKTKKEAEEFSRVGAEAVDVTDRTSEKTTSGQNLLAVEKTSAFKGPKPQELVQLRKAIERGDITKFKETVWRNPRYLVSSGDTPTILQEGSRYNALHIASKAGHAAICEAILETVNNPSFIHLLYNGADESMDSNRLVGPSTASLSVQENQALLDCAVHLLDLYLNTPDKGCNETPLHFACKFGRVDAVRVLVSYPACDRTLPNKSGEIPEDVICSRCNSATEEDRKKIRQLLKDRYYVPLLRPEDFSQQACIGEPFSPEKILISSPESRRDPTSPMQAINAYAGPMTLDEAKDFCKRWKSPVNALVNKPSLRSMSPAHRSIMSSSSGSPTPFRLCDPERGLEREGRTLANELRVQWMEYWPFLGAFANFATKDGMKALEKYLCQKLQDSFLRRMSSEKMEEETPEVIEVEASNEVSVQGMNFDQKITPITELCHALESCSLSSGKKNDDHQNKLSHDTHNPVESLSFSSPTSHQYVEKSCRIFARRISDSLIRESFRGSKRVPCTSIGPEIHHIKRLVSSFKEDSRFLSIDFSCMHSRLSTLVADGVLESVSSSDALKVIDSLANLPTSSTYMCYSSDEEDDKFFEKECESPLSAREWRKKKHHNFRRLDGFQLEEEMKHVRCLVSLIKEALVKKTQDSTTLSNLEDGESIEYVWEKAKPCSCSWPNSNALYGHNKVSNRISLATISRRLSFDNIQADDSQTEENPSEISNCQSTTSCTKIFKGIDSMEHSAGEIDIVDCQKSSDVEDVFYTPPSSPAKYNHQVSVSDDELMEDAVEITNIFIDGDQPTKLDLDVLYALEGAGHINPMEFPFIYQWKNLVLMHSLEERASWQSPLAPGWRKKSSIFSGRSMGKSHIGHESSSPSLLFSNKPHLYNCSPLVKTHTLSR